MRPDKVCQGTGLFSPCGPVQERVQSGGTFFDNKHHGRGKRCVSQRCERPSPIALGMLCRLFNMRGFICLYISVLVTFLRGRVPLAAVSFLVAGCAMQSSVRMQPIILDYDPPSRMANVPIPNNLMVYQFLLAESVNPQYVTIVEPGSSVSQRAVERWRENPAEMITNLTLRDLARSGMFEHVVDQFSTMSYRYALDGTIRALQGQIRDKKVFAVLHLEASLIDFEVAWASDKIIFTKTYHVEIPCKDSSASAIAASLNRAVAEYSRLLRTDLETLLAGKGSPQ